MGHLGIFPTWVCVTQQPELPVGVNCSLMNGCTRTASLTLSVIFNPGLLSHFLANLACTRNKPWISSRRLYPLTVAIQRPWSLLPVSSATVDPRSFFGRWASFPDHPANPAGSQVLDSFPCSVEVDGCRGTRYSAPCDLKVPMRSSPPPANCGGTRL